MLYQKYFSLTLLCQFNWLYMIRITIGSIFQNVLEKNGYQVKSASDGALALEILDKEYIDLIISDIMMPVMDG